MPVKRQRAEHLGPERRRPLVLDAALPLFLDHGYAGTSIDMIAEAAEVTRPVIYDCFPNKEELFRALLEREEGRLLEHLLAALPQEPDFENTEALLTESFTAFLEAAAEMPDSWRLLMLSERGIDPTVARRVVEARTMVTDRIGELARVVLEHRGATDAARKAALVAHMIVGMGEASVRLMLSRPGEWTPTELGALLGRMTAPAERVLADQGR